MMNSCRFQRGFSAIELVVYITIVFLVSTAALTVLFSMQEVFTEYRAQQTLLRAGSTAIERMNRDIQNANLINVGATTAPTNPNGTLSLESVGGTTTEFSVAGHTLTVSVDGGTAEALTGPAVTVNEFRIFTYSNAETDLVRYRLTLTASSGPATSSRTFYGAGVLRNSYD